MQMQQKMRLLIIFLILVTHQCGSDGHGKGLRTKRQIPKDIKQGCVTTGYEKRIRSICEEVLDKICKPVKEVEYRKEIQTRCDTRIQQKCNTTIRERPREVCKERTRTQCFQDFKLVEETTYDHECENIVQHICEEHYKVPVPVPVPVPHPVYIPHPAPHLQKLTQVVRSLPRIPRQGSQRQKRDSQVIDHRQLLFELKNALKAPIQPVVHHQELPAPPGCRSLVTQKCHKIPVKFNRKLPKESCQEVPDIQCHMELEEYEEPVCENVPVEECEDVYKEIPFLVDDEECEDVPRLDCTEVEEEVPIQVCTNIDIQRDVIISKFGRTYSVDGTETKTLGAEIVGRIPNITVTEEEEERSGRFLKDRDSRPVNLEDIRGRVFGSSSGTEKSGARSSRRREEVVNLLKRLLAEQDY